MWTKILTVSLALVMVLSLAACAKEEAEKDARMSQAQELYDFATEALKISEELQSMTSYAVTVPGNTTTELQKSLWRCADIKDSLEWLYAPENTIAIKDSLLREVELVERYVMYLQYSIWARDETYEFINLASEEYIDRAFDLRHQEIDPLSQENRRNLINLQLQAEHDLKQ